MYEKKPRHFARRYLSTGIKRQSADNCYEEINCVENRTQKERFGHIDRVTVRERSERLCPVIKSLNHLRGGRPAGIVLQPANVVCRRIIAYVGVVVFFRTFVLVMVFIIAWSPFNIL